MRERYYLGVDGGGSHTVALVAGADGRVVGRGVAGPSNLHRVGEQAAKEALQAAVDTALAAAAAGRQSVAAACLGLAGVGGPAERNLFQRWAQAEGLGARVLVVIDCDLLLAAGTPDGWGLALTAGTGSIAWGRDQAGRCARAGGWGYLLGDEGSGYAVGLAALRAIAQAADGRGPPTALRGAILHHWRLAEPEELIERVYHAPIPHIEIAALAPLVEAAAAWGDAVAGGIVRAAGDDLARALAAVAQSLGLAGVPVPLALGGGLLVRGRLVACRLLEGAAELGLALRPVARVGEPALGALRLAQGEVAVDGSKSSTAQVRGPCAGDEAVKG